MMAIMAIVMRAERETNLLLLETLRQWPIIGLKGYNGDDGAFQ